MRFCKHCGNAIESHDFTGMALWAHIDQKDNFMGYRCATNIYQEAEPVDDGVFPEVAVKSVSEDI